jgi:hypothetical protein
MAQRSMMEEMDVAKLQRAAPSLTSVQKVHPPGFGTARHRASSVAPGCPLWCLRKEKKRLKTQSLEQCTAGFIQIHSIFWIVSGFSEEKCGNLIDFLDQELLEKTIRNNLNYESMPGPIIVGASGAEKYRRPYSTVKRSVAMISMTSRTFRKHPKHQKHRATSNNNIQ